MSDVVPQIDESPEVAAELPPAPPRTARIVGVALIVLSVVLGWLLLVGFLGYQSGERQLAARQENELLTSLERQTTLAAENIDQGNAQLALRRLEWVLAREPANREALRLQEAAQQALNQSAAPTPVQAAPAPTIPPEPTPTPGQITSPEAELQRIRRLSVNKAWQESVTAMVAFQQQFPSYEREETDRLLYDAYLGYSQELLVNEQAELGLFYLAQAEKLGDLPQAMIDYRTWAELYTQGIAFYGVNWDAAAYYFRDLCLAAPFYGDSCTKLQNILLAHGDHYASLQDWCPAQQLYEEARQQGSRPDVGTKLDAAREGCLSATPTPSGPITGTVPLSETQSLPGEPFVVPPTDP